MSNHKNKPNVRLSAALYIGGLLIVSLFLYGMVFTKAYPAVASRVTSEEESVESGETSTESVEPVRPAQNYSVYGEEEKKTTVLLDAGHGGIDAGKVSGEVMEKDLNLEITNKVAKYLQEYNPNIEVKLIRSTDDVPWLTDEETDLNYRVDQMSAQNAEYFISIHCNAYQDDPSVRGSVFFVNPNDQVMKDMAAKMTTNLQGINWTSSYSTLDHEILQVVSMAPIHSMLVEVGYMTNTEELTKLSDPTEQDEVAKAIAGAISDYIHENPDAPAFENQLYPASTEPAQ